ncbi:MAG: hypothetical protein KGY60_01050 [Bacteroidales bacterium]|nr:hypothetical protein [Bacteroidales bacterium]
MSSPAKEDLILTTAFSVTSADTDMYNRLRPGGLMNYLIQASIQSADSLGFGFGGLRKQHLFWVLSRLTLDIYRPLQWYESLEVETWAKDVEKLIYLRDYIVRDGEKQEVARGTSGWLAIDQQTKRPKRLEGVEAEIFEQLRERHGLERSPLKLARARDGQLYEIQPTYYDFDLNRHVTSTRYIDWMMDTFSFDFHGKHYPRHLSVNYMKETRPRETLRMYRDQEDETTYQFEGIHATTGKPSFRGKVDF